MLVPLGCALRRHLGSIPAKGSFGVQGARNLSFLQHVLWLPLILRCSDPLLLSF